jgi:ATP-dependent phosphofructokinase / diphosphate-dependent phosphofructokinase
MADIKKKIIGVLTGGGDCAGLNSAIKWVVRTALDKRLEKEKGVQFEVLGIKEGWKGLSFNTDSQQEMENNIWPLNEEIVENWDRIGGTNLGSSRFNPYNPNKDTSRVTLNNIEKLGLDVLIAIGGDDTLSVAARLSGDGVSVVGIPKTIDKDLPETDYTLGFQTAVEIITSMVDNLRSTANSHRRIMVVEVMGRTAGWLALRGGEASGADLILIPEYDFSIERINELVLADRKAGSLYDIVVVAEGAKPTGGARVVKDGKIDMFGHETLGGVGEFLASEINKGTGVETRSVVLSHLQRGGTPVAYDRRMGRYFGIGAVNLVEQEQFGQMVCLKNGHITSVPISKVLEHLSLVDVKTMYDIEKYNGTRHTMGLGV